MNFRCKKGIWQIPIRLNALMTRTKNISKFRFMSYYDLYCRFYKNCHCTSASTSPQLNKPQIQKAFEMFSWKGPQQPRHYWNDQERKDWLNGELQIQCLKWIFLKLKWIFLKLKWFFLIEMKRLCKVIFFEKGPRHYSNDRERKRLNGMIVKLKFMPIIIRKCGLITIFI